MNLEVIILAAGQGTRMRSNFPKVLHKLAGKPMLSHVISAANKLQASSIHVVVGHGAETVKQEITEEDIQWALQAEQLGTGHAVAQAMPGVSADATVLICYGDVPLVKDDTLTKLVNQVDENAMALLTVNLDDPTGYGRIVRNEKDEVTSIVEQKDASAEILTIKEVNTGILAVSAKKLNQWLPQLSSENAQGEYYLTDIIAMAVKEGMIVQTHQPESEWEVQGVNNRQQLSELERVFQTQQANKLMENGATLADPARVDIRGELTVGKDVFIDINCLFIGDVTLADNVVIGPNCVIESTSIGQGSIIKANCVLEDAVIKSRCDVGPYARLRPGTMLSDTAKVGNFVETKKTNVGEGSKINHLSYVGDSELGSNVNIGAGTITCNYDGVNKSKTIIGDDAFIGSNTALVAPVNVGKKATIGAGSTITSDVAEEQLSVTRTKQQNIDGWKRPTKKQ